MKHSLKFSSLIIFATTIASAFTSCGNDSELFDEPVMFQTRAMTRASMRTEQIKSRLLFDEEGTNEASVNVELGTYGTAQTFFSWQIDADTRLTSSISMDPCSIALKDTSIYVVTNNTPRPGYRGVDNNNKVYGHCYIRITNKDGKEVFGKEVRLETVKTVRTRFSE